MAWLTKISAQTRLSIVFAALTLLAAWFAGSAILDAVYYQEQLSELQSLLNERQRRSNAVENFITEQLALRGILLDPEYTEMNLADVLRFRDSFQAFILYEQMNPEAEAAAGLDELRAERAVYDEAVDALIEAAQDGADAEAILDRLDNVLFPQEEQVLYLLKALEQEAGREIQAQVTGMQTAFKGTARVGNLWLLSLGLMLVAGVAVANGIFQPLQALLNAVHQFEAGEFAPRLLRRYTGRRDELGEITSAFSSMATAMIESNRLKEKFLASASRFIPQQYLEFLEKDDITQVDLGDHVAAEMAVMFSDIRGFTSMSETMTAQENFEFVNDYLQQVSPVIQDNDGFIVKFLGDGMMAIFPYGVDDAIEAGVAKQKMVTAFNAQLAGRGLPPISVGVGIHTGSMMVGMIGEEDRLQGDAFSDNVNLTARVEGLNKFFGTSMIISEDTLCLLSHPERYKMRFLGKAIVKGRVAPLGLYEVYHGLSEETAARREAAKASFERGLALYSKGQFTAAQDAFQAVLAQDPDDKTAHYYLENCRRYGTQAVPAGWDGVIAMDSK